MYGTVRPLLQCCLLFMHQPCISASCGGCNNSCCNQIICHSTRPPLFLKLRRCLFSGNPLLTDFRLDMNDLSCDTVDICVQHDRLGSPLSHLVNQKFQFSAVFAVWNVLVYMDSLPSGNNVLFVMPTAAAAASLLQTSGSKLLSTVITGLFRIIFAK